MRHSTVPAVQLNDDLALALRLADTAAERSLAYFRSELQQWNKGDGSLATEADLAVEDALRALLRVERPGDAVLGEERGKTGDDARCWIIDGIDGTVNFAAGQPNWGTLVALAIDGEVVVGLCDQPVHKRRYWAIKGGGAFCSHGEGATTRLRTSTHAELRSARSYVPSSEWVPDEDARTIASALQQATMSAPHVNHPAVQVALGDYEFAVFFITGPWDIAAPALLVEEAGGRFSDLDGERRLTSGNVLFSNGLVHDDVVALIASARKR